MDCDAKQNYVNDYMKQLWHEPVGTEKGSKGNKQTQTRPGN